MIRFLILALLSYSASAQSWPDHVVSGMYGPPSNAADYKFGGAAPFGLHEARPATMPKYWDWSWGARGGRWNDVKAGEATGVNGLVGHVSGSLDYKIEARNMEVWMLVNGKWERKYTTAGRDAAAIYGSFYRMSDFSHGGGMTETVGPAGGSMFPVRDAYWSHFYCQGVPLARIVIPTGFQRLHVRLEMRMVGNAAATSVAVGRASADYFLTVDQSAPASDVQPSAFSARIRKLGPEFRWFTATSMTADEIRANPPPAPDNWPVPVPPLPPKPDYSAILMRLQSEHRALGETIDELSKALE